MLTHPDDLAILDRIRRGEMREQVRRIRVRARRPGRRSRGPT